MQDEILCRYHCKTSYHREEYGRRSKQVYTFEVQKDATKAEIASAVEAMFKKTKVVKVNVINMKKKPKRYSVHFGYTGEWKKAIVTLSEDSAPIAFFESMN